MTYTNCEVCHRKQYCFLQFRPDAQEDENVVIKRAVCPQCLALVYHTTKNSKPVKILSYYS